MSCAPCAERAFLSPGSNLGDRQANLTEAVRRLRAASCVAITDISSVYETAPIGVTDQPCFLNIVVALQATCTAPELLALCLRIEADMGRVRAERWGPRNIDIDLLLYGAARIDEADLAVPHPRMAERRFVLVPLAEIAPDVVLADGRTAASAAAEAATAAAAGGNAAGGVERLGQLEARP